MNITDSGLFYKNHDIKEIDTLIRNLEEKAQSIKSKTKEGFLSKLFSGRNVQKEARSLITEYITDLKDPKFKIQSDIHKKMLEIYQILTEIPESEKNKTEQAAQGLEGILLYAKGTDDDALEMKEIAEEFKDEPIQMDDKSKGYLFKPRLSSEVPSVPSRLLYHIHTGEAHSELEGMDPREAEYMRKYLAAYLRDRPDLISPPVLDELENSIQIHEKEGWNPTKPSSRQLKEAKNQIQNAFDKGKPVLLVGGWKGQPGHAVYYEIIPDPRNRDKANFRIYNTGAGIKYHPHVNEGNKVKYQAYCEWQGIDRAKFEADFFLQSVFEMNSFTELPSSSTKTDYNERDIYEGLKKYLNPTDMAPIPKDISKSLLMSPQPSGICTWKSLMAFLRTNMPYNDYKRFQCDIKLQSLISFVSTSKGKPSPVDWRLVKNSHQKLCLSLLDLHKKKLIGDEYLNSVHSSLNNIAKWIKDNSTCKYPPKVKVEDVKFISKKIEGVPFQPPNYSDIKTLNQIKNDAKILSVETQPCNYTIEEFNKISIKDPKSIKKSLLAATELSTKAWMNHEDLALHKGIIDFISRLDLKDNFWKESFQRKEESENLITILGELSSFFLKSCYTIPESQIVFSEKVYALKKILFIQQQLCRLGHPDSPWKGILLNDVKDVKFDPRVGSHIGNLFFCLPNAKMQRDWDFMLESQNKRETENNDKKKENILLNPKVRISDEAGLISYFSSEKTGQSEFVLANTVSEKDPQTQTTKNANRSFEEVIRRECPEVIKSIEIRDSSFERKNLPTQDALIYSSDFLPPWIKAMRDTHLGSKQLTLSQVGPLSTLDRSRSLEPRFFVQPDDEKNTHVRISFEGVTPEIEEYSYDRPLLKPPPKYVPSRYEGQYSPITSGSIQKLIPLLNEVIVNPVYQEKKVLNEDIKKRQINMLDEECKEFARLFINSDLQLVETMEYFTKHPEKLKDRDYQTLLHALVFNQGLLDKHLKVEGFAQQLVHFIENHFSHFSAENELQASVFLLRMAHQLNNFCPGHPFFQSTEEKLTNLLKRDGLSPEDKGLIYAELIAEYGHKEKLSDKEIETLLTGSLYINEADMTKLADPFTLKEVRETLVLHAKRIQESLLSKGKPNESLLNQLLNSIRPKAGDKKWEGIENAGQFPLFRTTDGILYYPLLSRLLTPTGTQLVPREIRNHPDFHRLFPNVTRAECYAGGLFSFRDNFGHPTHVHKKGDNLIIEQELTINDKKGWFRFVSEDLFLAENKNKELVSSIGSRYLINQYTHWQALEQPNDIIVIDPKSGNPQYRIDIETVLPPPKEDYTRPGRRRAYDFTLEDDKHRFDQTPSFTIKNVSRLSDQAALGVPSNLFAHFEDPAYIHEWYDSKGQLQNIELPRFNLSFKPDAANRLMCEQFPGYYLNTRDPIPELGVHSSCLLLQNDQEKQLKVLLPQQFFQPYDKKEVLLPRYGIDRHLKKDERNAEKYLVFNVQRDQTARPGQKGQLINKSREANLYLALVLGTAQEYKSGIRYLKKHGDKLSAFSGMESQILKEISEIKEVTGDVSGNGTAFQLYAQFLLAKNALSNQKTVSKEDMDNLRSLYDKYLTRFFNLTVFKLSPDEELFVLKILLHEKYEAKFFLRLKELDPIYAQNFARNRQTESPSSAQEQSLKGFVIPQVYQGDSTCKAPKNPVLATRLDEALEKHFGYYYNMAISGSPTDKQWLKDALNFVQSSKEGKNAAAANFFEAVLNDSAKFPPLAPPSSSYATDFTAEQKMKEWRKKVEEEAASYLQKQKSPEMIPSLDLGDITPKGFRFEPKITPIREVKLSYQLPKVRTMSQTLGFENNITPKKPSPQNISSTLNENLIAWKNNSADPLQQKEFDRLSEDCKEFQSQPKPGGYTIKQGTKENQFLDEVRSKLKINEKTQELTHLKDKMLALVNRPPLTASEQSVSQHYLQKWGGVKRKITLDELIVNFAHQDPKTLLERNPLLTDKEINDLYQFVHEYLLLATKEQQRKRVETALNKYESITPATSTYPEEKSDLFNQLANEALATHEFVNDPKKSPAYLAFEYYGDLLMRKNQVDMLDKFFKTGDINLIAEMIMGSGKSKVLLPLLGVLRADKDKLSLLIVPQPLFESISQDTQNILRDAFGKSLRSLHFDRNTQFTVQSLESILDELTQIKKNGQCLIMTSKSVQCLVLKFIEKSAEHFKASGTKEFPKELKIMSKILNLLRSSGYPIIDEADTVLNILHEVCFSFGDRLAPKQQELELLSVIYDELYKNPKLKNIARLESDPTPNPKAPILTEELYFKELQGPLTQAILTRFKSMKFDSNDQLTKKINTFAEKLNPKDGILLTDYLCRNKNNLPAAQAYFNSLDKDIQDIVALAGEEISHLLPHTLTKTCDEKYGLDDILNQLFAIPFSAANTPNTGSQFANPHITMNYTFQTYLKKGVTYEMVESQIKLLQDKYLREKATYGDKVDVKQLSSWKTFEKLKGKDSEMPLFNYKPKDLQAVVDRINANSKERLDLVSSIILPGMLLFEKKMSCNPHQLVTLFLMVTGFTGTLWNTSSMHHKLKPEPAKGTDAKTLSILSTNPKTDVISIDVGTTQQMLKALGPINYDMISDAGGYFKDGNNASIAHQLAQQRGKEVVYYNKQGEQTITDGEKDLPFAQTTKSEGDRITFLDQSHTIGADVKQKRDAVGLVTISRNMLLRDLLQSVWRLRELDKSQSVRFVTNHEVEGIIRQRLQLKENQKIGFYEILRFAIVNQAEQQGQDNYKALKQELALLPQQILLMALLDEKLHPANRLHVFEMLQSEWIQSAVLTSRELYGELVADVDSKDAINEACVQCSKKIDDLFTKMPWLEKMGISKYDYSKEINDIKRRLHDQVPARVPVKDNKDNQTMEVEQETKKETQTQTETELKEEQYPPTDEMMKLAVISPEIEACKTFLTALVRWDHLIKTRTNLVDDTIISDKEKVPSFPLGSYLLEGGNKALASYASAFEGINLTMNVLEWKPSMGDPYDETHFELLGASSHRTPFHHLLIKEKGKGEVEVTLLSQAEARKHWGKPEYYNLTLGYNDRTKKPSREAMVKIVKLKFLNGEVLYTDEEKKILRDWLKAAGPVKMRTLFEDYVLKGFPGKAAAYRHSLLKQLLADLCKK